MEYIYIYKYNIQLNKEDEAENILYSFVQAIELRGNIEWAMLTLFI